MKIDGNNRYVLMGEDPDGNPKELKVDPSTGYLLVSVMSVGAASGTPSATTVDDNTRSVCTAENPSGSTFIIQTNNSGHLYTTTA